MSSAPLRDLLPSSLGRDWRHESLPCLSGFFWDPLSQGMQNFLQSSTGKPSPGCGIWPPVESISNKGSLRTRGRHQAQAWLRAVQEIESRAADFRVSFQQRGPPLRVFLAILYRPKRTISSPNSSRRRRPRWFRSRSLQPPSWTRRRRCRRSAASWKTMKRQSSGSTLGRNREDDPLEGDQQRAASRFDLVICNRLQGIDILKVQEDIAVRLGYSRPEKAGPDLLAHPTDRVNTLLSASPGGISFCCWTTCILHHTIREVCNDMDAHGKLRCPLESESSWTLFCEKIGKRRRPAGPWRMAPPMASGKRLLMALKGIPVELGDMTEVLILLEFSFDRLKIHPRSAFSTCALFSEDHNILISELIDYWVGEGLLDRGRHPDPLRELAACLLEDGKDKGRHVKLHDTVREMALWITSGEGDKRGNVFLVNSGEKLRYVPTPERWTEARRISLMPSLPNLQTLLLNDNEHHLEEIPGGFFQFMPSLRVLDLSWTGIRVLPPEIKSLLELRYLNLSWIPGIITMEVSNLTKLRQLHLENTLSFKSIPREAVSSLERLQSLNIYGSNYEFRAGGEGGGSDGVIDREGRQLCLKDLEDGMWNLTELGISITWMTHEDLEAVLNSQRLSASIRFLCVLEVGIRSLDLLEYWNSTAWKSWSSTRTIFGAGELTLGELPRATISWKDATCLCEALEDITWIRQLSALRVGTTWMFENRRGDSNLPNLSICRHPLLFPALEDIKVINCPELKKLPFGLSTAKNIQCIFGEKEWFGTIRLGA
ncbi:unnamed protein product [Spirodela intermedia]|uniref:Uncharacterized protein n=1 Tax=Spirodela intermedia TaxID=51605 RepID=A0ABN7E9T1_SPIIN|nr:unnamed protein product [Spirodela intermedia]